MNHSMVNYSVCNPPERKKVFDLLQVDTHVNVALHKDIFVSCPSKNNKIYLDIGYEWHFYILTYIAHCKNLEFWYKFQWMI